MAPVATVKRRKGHGLSVAPSLDDGPFVRKKLKSTDLPITSGQRAAMDSLLHTFTKKGEFDKLRKSIFAKIEQSVSLQTPFRR